jgi:PTH1 family peptidyl-tRNA hydrolase
MLNPTVKNNVKVIVGLGNPGPDYVNSRHNFGWFVVDELATRAGIKSSREICGGVFGEKDKLAVFKPMSFMNKSGYPVVRLVRKFDIPHENLLIVMDDLDLNLGTLRLRTGGSSGGHRGLQSIIDFLGTDEINRLKLGTGPRPPEMPARNFVLGNFSKKEGELVEKVVDRGVQAVYCWAQEGPEAAMDKFNDDVTDG